MHWWFLTSVKVPVKARYTGGQNLLCGITFKVWHLKRSVFLKLKDLITKF